VDQYLRGGALVLTTTAMTGDVLDPAAVAVVSANRTDGEWIWTDPAEYYLSRQGLATDAGLDQHIRYQLSVVRSCPWRILRTPP
jgi:hypothetical protein